MTFWGKLGALMPWADKNEPTQCMYEGCEIVVAPDDHADQNVIDSVF